MGENTWEPLDNLGEAEKEQEMKGQAAIMKVQNRNNKRKTFAQVTKEPPAKTPRVEAKGFARGLAAEKIIGIRRESVDKVFFLVKWRGTEESDFVNAKEAKAKIPLVVIDFYEEKLAWFADDGQDEE